ncbi:Os02g0214000 [Oryza sativa Japonica Group]|uniref:Os02g0214000 protein n=2 Tax=Oryza sativa subsp. japonica TaxID=39947 RepID=B9F495_ORYSJ|nr:hypothetical protein OsJ_05876 [Oryza sativa Japonica Group]KAF2943745.1 hypothetical protein DAI22_02g087900 [Oryza sativa Japonica Group]BAS77617.1 Os02g0214000 [Oryza sativa Japonica Group]
MALLPLRRRHRLLAVVQLAVALWLAATSGYRCKLVVDGGHTPVTPPSPRARWRPQPMPSVCPREGCFWSPPSARQP